MTDRTPDDQLDREIRSFLAWQAEDVSNAPTATDVAMRISARMGTRTGRPRLAPQLAWAALAGLLIAALMGALVAGAMLRRDRPPVAGPYEAVFLRLEVLAREPIVHVVGVTTGGAEREIAALPAWHDYHIGSGYLAPVGSVSESGLLAIPSSSDDSWMMRWEIFDLFRPNDDPLVVPEVRGNIEVLDTGVFWGPADRLAIPWRTFGSSGREMLSFVDGRTGGASSVGLPDGLTVLARWTADGSGVFVGGVEGSDAPRGVLHPDGSLTDAYAGGTESGCRLRADRPASDRATMGCVSPDSLAAVHHIEVPAGPDVGPASHPRVALTVPGTGARFEIEGTFAGWLEVDR